MSRVGGVGGQQNSCVRKKSRLSETSDVLFYSVIFTHIVHVLSPLAGAEQLFEQAPLHAAALIYERNNKSAKLW